MSKSSEKSLGNLSKNDRKFVREDPRNRSHKTIVSGSKNTPKTFKFRSMSVSVCVWQRERLPRASWTLLKAFWPRPGRPRGALLNAPGLSQERSWGLAGALFRVPGPSRQRPGAPPQRLGSPKTAQDRFFVDFSSIWHRFCFDFSFDFRPC